MTAIERLHLFQEVRSVAYATDGVHDAASLMTVGRGDCLAKSAYLFREFTALGLQARRVRWLYHLPSQPPEVGLLPSREDVHTAVEVRTGRNWDLVDATHDPALSKAGFTVADDWDGVSGTVPAHPPAGRIWRAGDAAPEPVPNAACREPFSPSAGRLYRAAFNRWLHHLRAAAATPPNPPRPTTGRAQ